MTSITVEDLIKHLERLQARGPIPFDVRKGEIFGILCSSGTGRSTLISILMTMLIPVPGFAERSPFAILGNLGDMRRTMGLILPESILNHTMTARENLDFYARLHGLNERARERRVGEVLGHVELIESADIPVATFSTAMVRRLEIARSLLIHPKILFLSEPTDGMESFEQRGIWGLLKRLNRHRGVTIVFTTHRVDEADAVCDRIAVVDGGEIVALDTPDTFREILGGGDSLPEPGGSL
jgi:ABC-2 type transport system ATP-binding protein